MNTTKALCGTLFLMLLAAAACGPCPTRQAVGQHAANVAYNVELGWVDSVRPAHLQAQETGLGATAGATAGVIAGSEVGHGSGTALAQLAGFVLGMLAGSAFERSASSQDGQEITVQLDSGEFISVVQAGKDRFARGDEVEVLRGPDGGTHVRHRGA